MKEMKLFALVLMALLSFSVLVRATDISNCQDLSDGDNSYYELTQNLTYNGDEYCLSSSGYSNVTIDCNGHSINGVGSGVGIFLYDTTHIKNCIITNFTYGIYNSYSYNTVENTTFTNNDYGLEIEEWGDSFDNVTNCIFRNNSQGLLLLASDNVSITNSSFYDNSYAVYSVSSSYVVISDSEFVNNSAGIYETASSYSTYENLMLYNNAYGFYLNNQCNYNTFDNVVMDTNGEGIYFDYDNNNTMKNCVIKNSLDYGIYYYDASPPAEPSGGNIFYNNTFNNTNNVFLELDGEGELFYENFWNTSVGNYWGAPDLTGFSDTCVDANTDGFCDDTYEIGTNNVDYLPLALFEEYIPTPPSALSCSGSLMCSTFAGLIIIALTASCLILLTGDDLTVERIELIAAIILVTVVFIVAISGL